MNSSATAVSLREKFGQFTEHWSPKKIAALNDYEIKIVKIKGEFVWHSHTDTDEMFLVTKGRFESNSETEMFDWGPVNCSWYLAESNIARSPRTKRR